MWVQLNNQIVPEAKAVVSVFDRGFLYGDGVFETMRAYRRQVFRLDDHLRRLVGSATAIRLRLPRSASQIREDITQLLEKNHLADAVVRLAVSRGRGRRGPGTAGADSPTYVLSTEPLPDSLAERQTHGLRLGLSSVRRVAPDALPAHAKHANYLNAILAHEEAASAGADEALMLTTSAHIAECATANIFFVRGTRLCTPSLATGALCGITRAVVLDVARVAGLETEEALFTMHTQRDANEVFVTNSVLGLCPVRSVDARTYPAPGPVTQQLLDLYRDKVRGDTGGAH